jgi:glycerophosphoryl diester phosphodiesterase
MFIGGCAQIETKNTEAGASVAAKTGQRLLDRLRGPAVGGHQGDIFSFKFNTVAGFNIARNAGVDVVEMDLLLTKDHIPIVYHDSALARFTKCHGHVKDYTLAEIGHCEFRLSNEKIPRFEDVLMWSRGNIVINAEFKELAVIDSALALVATYNAYEWVYFQVMSDEQYTRVRQLDTKVNILRPARDRADLERIIALQDEHVLIIELTRGTATPENIAYVHANGKLASKDAFDFDPLNELFVTQCSKVFVRNIDIAISNRPSVCVLQKENFLKKAKP